MSGCRSLFLCGYVLTAVFHTTLPASVRDRCVDPPDLSARLSASNSQLPPSLETPDPRPRLNEPLSTDCPSHVPTTGPISDRSNCPWYYAPQTDSSRFPNMILRAELKCGYFCRRPKRNGRLVEMTAGRCLPIFDTVRVLRHEGCSSGIKRYNLTEEQVPVAYTCVFPLVRESGSLQSIYGFAE
ncbi:interleukin-17C-like [Haliotis rufescens]|uniref:interleukin-17C-like n=1 Tax=Haliotis rufescens TaxID=6454 RepID=UPI00201F1A08|nr:interleukin-17C-like [Haliotis rufescens]